MDKRPGVIRLAVFGSHVENSSSPAIHALFAKQCGLSLDYRAIEANPENFARLLQDLAAQDAAGCNITVPLKYQAWKLAKRVSVSAQRAQAVNTLVFEHANDWYGDSTDGRGLVHDININLDHELSGARICIIGAGGAAASVLGDLLDTHPAGIVIANRTLERALKLQQIFGSEVAACSLDALGDLTPFDLVINASSAGHSGGRPELPMTMFRRNSLCYDLNYGSAAEPLHAYCSNNGILYQDGFGMLVEQAALSFELWTGQLPDTAPVLEELRGL